MLSWIMELADGSAILQDTDEYDRFQFDFREDLGYEIDTTISNP
jgi:hypothetical protein